MHDIDQIMVLLSEKSSPEEQALGIEMSRNVKCLKAFFQPYCDSYSKDVWSNCAKVIVARQDEDLLPYLCDMLVWVQDLNWPGAELILERLKIFQNYIFITHMATEFTTVATALGDKMWAQSLAELI